MCAECETLRKANESLHWRLEKVIEQHDLAEQDIAYKRRQIAALKQQLSAKRESEDVSQEIRDIFEYWVTATRKDPKRTKLNHQRKEAIRKALREDYSVEDIQHAIAGMAIDPFRKNGVVYNDLPIACRKVEFYRDKYDAHFERLQQTKQEVGEQARQTLIENCGRHYSRPDLPKRWADGFEMFASALRQRGCDIRPVAGRGDCFLAQCPAHDDRSPSLDVREADDGRVLAICRSHGCAWEDICAALGVDSRIFGPRGDHPVYGKPTIDGQQISFGSAA